MLFKDKSHFNTGDMLQSCTEHCYLSVFIYNIYQVRKIVKIVLKSL
jgi:hypothetical protein